VIIVVLGVILVMLFYSKEKPLWVTLSGGNPAQQELSELIDLGHNKGYKFSMETQGSIAKPWFSKLDQLTLSPKPPSTQMSFKKRGLDRCLDACETLDNQINIRNSPALFSLVIPVRKLMIILF